MLAVSRATNPECEHSKATCARWTSGRTFDLVLIHDAVMYMTTPDDLRAALATAARHCRLGGGIAVLPDCVRETLDVDVDTVSTGGEDAPDGRGMRYMEWSWDPDPDDTESITTYAFVVRHADGRVEVEGDVHHNGVFPRADLAGAARRGRLHGDVAPRSAGIVTCSPAAARPPRRRHRPNSPW